MTRTVATKLAQARKLIERGWTQRAFARGKSGLPVKPYGRAAVCYCAAGAIIRAGDCASIAGGCFSPEYKVFSRAVGGDVARWNDAPERTQAEVIEAFKRAEQLAGAE